MGWKCLSECRRRARMRHRRNDDDVDGRQENFPTKSWWFVWMWQTTERRWRRRWRRLTKTQKNMQFVKLFSVWPAPQVWRTQSANGRWVWTMAGARVWEQREVLGENLEDDYFIKWFRISNFGYIWIGIHKRRCRCVCVCVTFQLVASMPCIACVCEDDEWSY